MSFCTVCLKDSKEHSEKLWKMHKEITKCTFCSKTSDAHSEALWEMHKSAVDNALKKTKHKKLWSLKLGLGRDCPAILDNDFRFYDDFPTNPAEWLHPIYMACTECDLYLGNMEEDYADVLDGMCLKCFMEMTEQRDD